MSLLTLLTPFARLGMQPPLSISTHKSLGVDDGHVCRADQAYGGVYVRLNAI